MYVGFIICVNNVNNYVSEPWTLSATCLLCVRLFSTAADIIRWGYNDMIGLLCR